MGQIKRKEKKKIHQDKWDEMETHSGWETESMFDEGCITKVKVMISHDVDNRKWINRFYYSH